MSEHTPHITVIGGGAGSRAVLAGLRPHPVEVSAVVNMADNGGSSGMLRDEYDMLPPGDVRQAIVGLSEAPASRVEFFESRYPQTSYLAGHAIGNLLLADLTKQHGSFERAVTGVSQGMSVKGEVIPATLDIHDLVACIDGSRIRGEYQIGQEAFRPQDTPPTLWLEPDAKLHSRAAEAIETADMVVIAPGDLYGSLVPPLLLSGMRESIAEVRGPVVYVSNLVNKSHQTAGFSPVTYASELERVMGEESISDVIYNTGPLDASFMRRYGKPGEQATEPIAPADRGRYRLHGADLVRRAVPSQGDYQFIPRSRIRHDPRKLFHAITSLLNA